ncbi:MAG: ParA family protein [Rhodospirillaceae bacterium]
MTTERRMKRVLVSCPKGGAGKTNFSRNLAVAAVADGLDVSTVDLDPQQSLTKWMNKRPENAPTITHYAAGMEQVGELLGEVDDHDLMVIDTPPGIESYPDTMKLLVHECDFCLIPVQPFIDDIESVEKWMRFVIGMKRRAGYVINRANRRAKSTLAAKRRLTSSGPLCPIEVPQYESFADAAALGIGVLEIGGAQGRDDIVAVWHFVRGELGLTPVGVS